MKERRLIFRLLQYNYCLEEIVHLLRMRHEAVQLYYLDVNFRLKLKYS